MMPVTIVSGDRDDVVSIDIHSRAPATTLPQSRLIVLSGVGHTPHHAVPNAVAGAIEEIVAKSGDLRRSVARQPCETAGPPR